MRFSIFATPRSMSPADDRAILKRMTQFILDSEAQGFDAVFCPDHHFTGYSPMGADPFMYHAYLAGQLKRMYFGFSVLTLGLHHPVRFVERINMLDQLTDGRVLLGMGRGTTPEETIGFGVPFQESGDRVEENLQIAMELWARQPGDPPMHFETPTYKGSIVQRIVPEPYRKPHPMMMGVAFRESSIDRAAKHGFSAFVPGYRTDEDVQGEPPKVFVSNLAKYRQALAAAGHSAELEAECLGWTTHTRQCVHVAETDKQAREELQFILEQYQAAIDREAPFNKAAEAISGVDLPPPPDALSQNWIDTWCLWGSPGKVKEELQTYADLGVGNVLCSFTNGPATERRWSLAEQSRDLFAREVMPHFKASAPIKEPRPA
jgi:alkanesulfonate monooxygenase SsuD/methylene tetrahydromethanopterin reductase-like flavin-dependent oxidoreductase (luciferase family)